MFCSGCNTNVETNESLQCTGCSKYYCLKCLDVSPLQLQSEEYIAKVAKAWLCSFCTSLTNRRRRNDGTPVTGVNTKLLSGRGSVSGAEVTLDDSVMSWDGTLDDSKLPNNAHGTNELQEESLTTPPNTFQSLHNTPFQSDQHAKLLNSILLKVSALQTQFSAIQAIQADMNQVKSDVADMKNSLDSRLQEMSSRIDSIESRVTGLENCKAEVDELKNSVKNIVAEMRTNEQWVRRSNIQINGVPEARGENLYSILNSLAGLSGYPLNVATDIDFVTRVAVKNDTDSRKPKPIIVKLQARYKKDDFISSLRKLKNLKAKDLGFTNNDSRIYVNDHLSGFNKFLLKQAQLRKTQKQYKYCWVRNCTVMVRKTDNSPILYITTEEALNKIT
ncbi:uncharacterized protein LOC133534705 [Cydia pomonella]|uniref:uncharacterized protein LOC133534705 n=1 Tax=Cydia pomonella TaxID=82600 RepID=UPI002ADD8DCB|nr:uncharacterized protein LOC133534705 [Cydia pomonella]